MEGTSIVTTGEGRDHIELSLDAPMTITITDFDLSSDWIHWGYNTDLNPAAVEGWWTLVVNTYFPQAQYDGTDSIVLLPVIDENNQIVDGQVVTIVFEGVNVLDVSDFNLFP